MYIVPMAWLYVALMMAVAEANASNGTVLGAIITFLLYGLGPVALVVYLMGSPARRRAIKAQEAALGASTQSVTPDAGGHAAADAVASIRKEV
jgi:mannose/fructose/N-acetylgalactosamine-specific phosphotransferase system component IID